MSLKNSSPRGSIKNEEGVWGSRGHSTGLGTRDKFYTSFFPLPSFPFICKTRLHLVRCLRRSKVAFICCLHISERSTKSASSNLTRKQHSPFPCILF